MAPRRPPNLAMPRAPRRPPCVGRITLGAAIAITCLPGAANALTTPVLAGGGLSWGTGASVQVTASGGGLDAVGHEYRTSTDGGTSWSAVSPGSALTVTAEGETQVQFRAVDGLGGTSAWEGPGSDGTVRLDRTPPTVPVLSGAQATPANVNQVVLTASGATDATTSVAGYEYRTSTDRGVSWSTPSGGSTVTVTAEGETMVQVRAVDTAGNASAWQPAHAGGVDTSGVARIDRTPPARPQPVSGSGWPLTLSWAAVADAATYRLLRGGSSIGTVTATTMVDAGVGDRAAPAAPAGLTVTVPERGRVDVSWEAPADAGSEYAYAVRAVDAAGNQSEASTSSTVAAASGIARYIVYLDGQAVTSTTTPSARLTDLDPATARTITVAAVDGAGNTSAPSTGTRVLPDPGVAPTITLSTRRTMVRPGVPVDVEATVAGTAVGAVEWRLDGVLLATGSTLSHVFTEAGRYRVVAGVTGRSGTPVTSPVDIVVDARPPTMTLVVVRNVLRVDAADADTGVGAIRLLRGPGAPTSIGPTGLRLPEGRYAVVVRVEDTVGNTEDRRSAVLVDGTPPVVRVTAPPLAMPGRVIAEISVTDALSGVRRVTVDGVPLREGTTAAALRVGVRHGIRAEDHAGNRAVVSLRVAEMPNPPVRSPELDGATRDQLRFVPSAPAAVGVRRAVLRGVQSQLVAVQVLPPGWVVTDRYTVALLRAVQRYQRSIGVPPTGTIGPRTRAALMRDAARAQVTEAR